jgi:2-amino-4-hydroxy-6-hydroxymethyldihydropteridine diphosphokinase
MSPRAPVFLGLGYNVGERETAIERALAGLGSRGFRAVRVSSLYLTEPVGGPLQRWFVNAVAMGECELGPEALLDACLAVEAELGRVRDEWHGPRTIDIDLLLHGQAVVRTPRLTLPHPRLHERLFVLVPLAELDPRAWHPLLGLTAAEMLARCGDTSRVLLHAPSAARGR